MPGGLLPSTYGLSAREGLRIGLLSRVSQRINSFLTFLR